MMIGVLLMSFPLKVNICKCELIFVQIILSGMYRACTHNVDCTMFEYQNIIYYIFYL